MTATAGVVATDDDVCPHRGHRLLPSPQAYRWVGLQGRSSGIDLIVVGTLRRTVARDAYRREQLLAWWLIWTLAVVWRRARHRRPG